HVAGQDGVDGGVDVRRLHFLQVLRLIPAPAPPSSTGGMKAQRPAQPVVGVDALEERVELAHRSPCSLATQLEETPHRAVGLMRQDGGDRASAETPNYMSLPAHKRENPRDLISGRDLAFGERGDLGVDRDPLAVRDIARGLGELGVDMEAALVDDGVKY